MASKYNTPYFNKYLISINADVACLIQDFADYYNTVEFSDDKIDSIKKWFNPELRSKLKEYIPALGYKSPYIQYAEHAPIQTQTITFTNTTTTTTTNNLGYLTVT